MLLHILLQDLVQELGILFHIPSLLLVTYFVLMVHDIQNGVY